MGPGSGGPGLASIRPRPTPLSLADLLGDDYVAAVCEVSAFATGTDRDRLLELARRKIELCPSAHVDRCNGLLDHVGKRVSPGLSSSQTGAGVRSFSTSAKLDAAPLSGYGFVRFGQDGRAYLTAKSEHYHASLGHRFPGYELLGFAREIGIVNATHNNTRGYVGRLAERQLVRVANSLSPRNEAGLEEVIRSQDPRVLNRVMNIQTGSLAAEAVLKMMLARFYRLEPDQPAPVHQGKTPVILVIGDNSDGPQANYHGTTTLAQCTRDMWPDLVAKLAESGSLEIRPVRINDAADFATAIKESSFGNRRVAGFIHEIVLMNYGAIRLDPGYLRQVYAMCREVDVPVAVDEIQSGAWYPRVMLFPEYGLEPDIVAVGKGFTGGEYAASKVLATSALDNLPQFGALVTNGQEELSSLAYLITIAFVEANAQFIDEVGRYYTERLRQLASDFPEQIAAVEGDRHLSSVTFRSQDRAQQFTKALNARCIDISTQSYKAETPPAALTKLPVVSTPEMIEFLTSEMRKVLEETE